MFKKLYGKKSQPSPEKSDIERMEDEGDIAGLVKALKNKNEPDIREAAAKALCKVGNERAVEPLIECLLHDKEWVVRRYAAEALGIIGGPRVVEPLTAALKDPYVCNITGRAVVRIVAAKALEKIEAGKSATEPLEKLMARQWSNPSSSGEVMASVEALTRNCESTMGREVSKCLETIEELAKKKDPVVAEAMCYAALAARHYKVSYAAADVLKNEATPETIQILCDALQYDRDVYRPVREALHTLGVIGDTKAREPILNFLDDFRKDWSMKGNTFSSGMADAMTLAGHIDAEKSICIAACRALAALGGSEAGSTIEAVLTDPYWSKYNEIQDALPKFIAQVKQKASQNDEEAK
jgi:HEAT repeat protein